ncbi:hypothetical protein ACF0H5_000474 [Mactra antiquata]
MENFRVYVIPSLILLGFCHIISAEISSLPTNSNGDKSVIDNGGLDPDLKIKDPELSNTELEIIQNFTDALLPGPQIITENKDTLLDKPSLSNDELGTQPTDKDTAVDDIQSPSSGNRGIPLPTLYKDIKTVEPESDLSDGMQKVEKVLPVDDAAEEDKRIGTDEVASGSTDVGEKVDQVNPLKDNVEKKPVAADIVTSDAGTNIEKTSIVGTNFEETVDAGTNILNIDNAKTIVDGSIVKDADVDNKEDDDITPDAGHTEKDDGHVPLNAQGNRMMTGNVDWSKYEPEEDVDDKIVDKTEDAEVGNENLVKTTDPASTATTFTTNSWLEDNNMDNNEKTDLTNADNDEGADDNILAASTPAWTTNTDSFKNNDDDDDDDIWATNDDDDDDDDIWATSDDYDDGDYNNDVNSKEYNDNTDVWTGNEGGWEDSEEKDDDIWADDDDEDDMWDDDDDDDYSWDNDDDDSFDEDDDNNGNWKEDWWKAADGEGWKTTTESFSTTEWLSTTDFDIDEQAYNDRMKDYEAGKKLMESPHHFDNNAGVFAGAKIPEEHFSMNNEDRHLYTWTLVLGLCLVVGLFVVFYNRHKVERYIVGLRRPVRHGDEERNLLHHEYA